MVTNNFKERLQEQIQFNLIHVITALDSIIYVRTPPTIISISVIPYNPI